MIDSNVFPDGNAENFTYKEKIYHSLLEARLLRRYSAEFMNQLIDYLSIKQINFIPLSNKLIVLVDQLNPSQTLIKQIFSPWQRWPNTVSKIGFEKSSVNISSLFWRDCLHH